MNDRLEFLRYSLIGPLRTGSSLLSRCVDDHPQLICFCESEINRALYGDYLVQLHFRRMRAHGMIPAEIVGLLNGKKQQDSWSFEKWYREATSIVAKKYGKTSIVGVGDKSPDFFRSRELVEHLSREHRLIYTIRDPRAIYRSIWADKTQEFEKVRRWRAFQANYEVWKGFLDNSNVLIVRFEDLVAFPDDTMRSVFDHIGVSPSVEYSRDFERMYPQRFLWKRLVDNPSQGVRFNEGSSEKWKEELKPETIRKIQSEVVASEVMTRFDYAIYEEN